MESNTDTLEIKLFQIHDLAGKADKSQTTLFQLSITNYSEHYYVLPRSKANLKKNMHIYIPTMKL